MRYFQRKLIKKGHFPLVIATFLPYSQRILIFDNLQFHLTKRGIFLLFSYFCNPQIDNRI